jgi:hypothetical protein
MPRADPFFHGHTGGGSLPGRICPLRGWRWREQILGLVDQVLLLLLEIAEPVLGATAAIDEMNHGADEITDVTPTMQTLAPLVVPVETIDNIIAGIFNVSGDGRHDLQKLVDLLALGQITAGLGRESFLKLGGFFLCLVDKAPMLGLAAHQAGVAIPQFQVGAVEDIAVKGLGIWGKFRGRRQEHHGRQHIDFHLANVAATGGYLQEIESMRVPKCSGLAQFGD